MRTSTASRAAPSASTTSTLTPCSSSATTVAASVYSSGSAVKRPGVAVVLIGLVLPWRWWNAGGNRTFPRLYSGHRLGPVSQPVTWGSPPAERADAARNRRLLLATAREIIAGQGAGKLSVLK